MNNINIFILLEQARVFDWLIKNIILCIDEVLKINQMSRTSIIIDKSPKFFYCANNAMIYRYTIEIAKLFDFDSKSINFNKFKNELCRTGFESKYIELFKSKYGQCKVQIDNIKNRRNKILAHNDMEFFYNIKECNDKYKFELQDILELLRIMRRICYEFRMSYGIFDVAACDEEGYDDVKEILNNS